MATIPGSVIERYERFSLYNSPYPAHESGCAVDLYPGTDDARSPISGVVRDVRAVECPTRPYAASTDYLLLVDCGAHTARVLHVEPTVEPGEEIAVGDRIGTPVRSGFFGRWVDNHIHLGFRGSGRNPYRASGSLRLDVDVSVAGLAWDGTGTVIETGPRHVRLDSPTDGTRDGFTALADDDGVPLDGGLTHYAGGGTFAEADGERSLLGTVVGTADGRNVGWNDVAVTVNGCRATGISLFAAQVPFGIKLVFRDGHGFAVGDEVTVAVEPTTEPIRSG